MRTRAALREVALRHFVEHGFEAASVAAIAAEVGVTERTFYRHFATKDEVLFDDLVEGLDWFRTALRTRPRTRTWSARCSPRSARRRPTRR